MYNYNDVDRLSCLNIRFIIIVIIIIKREGLIDLRSVLSLHNMARVSVIKHI